MGLFEDWRVNGAVVALVVQVLLVVVVMIRVLLRPHREPAARIAWIVVVLTVPVVGILAYILFGEVNIGRRRVARMREVLESLPLVATETAGDPARTKASVPELYEHLFHIGESISGFRPVGGNDAVLLPNSNAVIDAMVADIDAAKDHVHLLFYIWLTDHNGCKVAEALKRAAARGVQCRAMADGLGSRVLIKSSQWRAMREAGVHVAVALPIANPLLTPLAGRIDIRNHRKMLIIDDRIAYSGSQNCADAEFLPKADYAPWVDCVVRFEGPIARQNQHLFVSDWMTYVDEDIRDLLRLPLPAPCGRIDAQVVGTGPTVRHSAMPEMFESLMYAARRELVISTPYYVPSESLQDSLCSTAYRGIETSIIFPARNDSWVVAAASRSYYAELLQAGVKVYEYVGGLLHAKTLTVDGQVTLIGSANMDRRSFELNYENNVLCYDAELTTAIRQRQQQYIAASQRVVAEQVAEWPKSRQLWNNTIAMLGPVL